ncbi:PREDICTED: tumor necrosis factor receptor superfamily member 5 [Gekko japonicus]|uniref:Tumor necrosis factor receptor superfamily member 5 n=1 Tax=Gekko japonicus TaxID=146911 RepID=A0ABM1JR26_GEKJA|nr:PREDICTED: tumor necrosis factor receptor superfamily member 5 [Gekko japonicus]
MRAAGRLEAWAGGALLLAWATCLAVDPQQQNCSRTQYEAHGKCCSRCPPGKKVSVPCAEGSDTVCAPCQSERFQDGWTQQTFCTPHRYCDQNVGLVVHIHGDATRDVVCQCQSGTHCSGLECHSCRENKACGPGEGVEEAATSERDTICTDCPAGFFSNVSSPTASCQPWSSCEATGLVHKADGTRFSDAICEDASKVRSGVLVPVALAAVILSLGCVGLLLWHRRRRRQDLPKWHHNADLLDPERREPGESDDPSPTLPIQETRPTTQEDDKDSCVAEQERL